jgi:hypothetical protein
VIRLVGERQWEDIKWNAWGHRTCVNRAGDVLSVGVPRHGSHVRPMSSCTLIDPLGAQAIH